MDSLSGGSSTGKIMEGPMLYGIIAVSIVIIIAIIYFIYVKARKYIRQRKIAADDECEDGETEGKWDIITAVKNLLSRQKKNVAAKCLETECETDV